MNAKHTHATVHPGDGPESLHALQDELFEFVTDNSESDAYHLHCAIVARQYDMLEALKAIRDAGNDFTGWHPKFRPAIEQIRAAIEKAEGAAS